MDSYSLNRKKNSKRIKTLHVAAFDGNVGDTGQILGFRQELYRNTLRQLEYTNLEIREFYQCWGKRKFDKDFIRLANDYDLIIFGGGDFLSMKWQYSVNGTTLDLSEAVLEQIKTPIFFNALGFDICSKLSLERQATFNAFIKRIVDNPKKYILSLRNDSSKNLMAMYLDNTLVERIDEVPDGGFFVQVKAYVHPEVAEGKSIICINPAADQIDTRFHDPAFSEEKFISGFARALTQILDQHPKVHLIFVPHVPVDQRHIFEIMNLMRDCDVRKRVTVAPYIAQFARADYVFDLYKKADIVIGGRMHSNVCAIAQGTPTIGILSKSKHKSIYRECGFEDRLIEIDVEEIEPKLIRMVSNILNHRQVYVDRNLALIEQLRYKLGEFHRKVDVWLDDKF